MFAILLIITVSTILISLVNVQFGRLQLEKRFKDFTFISGLPLIGNLFITIGQSNQDFVKLLNAIFGQTESPGYTWMANQLLIGIDKPEDIQAVLTSNITLKKAHMFKHIGHLNSLFVSPPKIWKKHRRWLSSTLSQKMVNDFVPMFNEGFKMMADQMEEFIDKDVDMCHVMFKASGDIALRTSFGIKWSIQNERGVVLHNAVSKFLNSVQQRMIRFWLKWDLIYKWTSQYKKEMAMKDTYESFCRAAYEAKVVEIAEKKCMGIDEINEARENNSMNFIQKCFQLKDENKFTMDDVHDELGFLFLASTDTSSNTIQAITLLLAINQNCQDRVFDELYEIFENQNDFVTTEHLGKMKYLELIIKESLRLFPIAPFFLRENSEDFQFRGVVVPKGTYFIMNILKIQRNQKYWGDNSMEFYPERFLTENFAKVHPYAYVPFSAGARNCVGKMYAMAALKISLAHILRRYKLTSRLKFEDIQIQANIVMKIINENPIQLHKRNWEKGSSFKKKKIVTLSPTSNLPYYENQ